MDPSLTDLTPGIQDISVSLARAALRNPELLASLAKKAVATESKHEADSDPVHCAWQATCKHLGLEEWSKSQALVYEKKATKDDESQSASSDKFAGEMARHAAQLEDPLRAALSQFLASKSGGANAHMLAADETSMGHLVARFLSGEDVHVPVADSSTVANMQEAIAALKLMPMSIIQLLGPEGQCLMPEQTVLEAVPLLSCIVLICDHAAFEVGDRIRAQWSSGCDEGGDRFEEAWYDGQVLGLWYEGALEHMVTRREQVVVADSGSLYNAFELDGAVDGAVEAIGWSQGSDYNALESVATDSLGSEIPDLVDNLYDMDLNKLSYPVTVGITFKYWECGEPRYRVHWADGSSSVVRREGTAWRTAHNGVIYVMEKVNK